MGIVIGGPVIRISRNGARSVKPAIKFLPFKCPDIEVWVVLVA